MTYFYFRITEDGIAYGTETFDDLASIRRFVRDFLVPTIYEGLIYIVGANTGDAKVFMAIFFVEGRIIVPVDSEDW